MCTLEILKTHITHVEILARQNNLQTLNAYLGKCKIHSPNNQTLNAYVRKCQILLPIIRYPF